MTTESYPEVCIPPTQSSASTATGARSLSFERVLNTTEGINKPVRLHLYLAAEDGCAWTDFEGVLASLVKVMSDLQVYEGQAVRSCREEAAYPAATLAAAEKASAPAEAQTASGSSFTFRNGLHWGMSPEEVLAAEGVSQFAYTKPISDRMMIQDLLVNLSKFVSDGAYIFVDNRLVMTAFSIESSSADDAAYLAAALEQVYGPGTREGALDSKPLFGTQRRKTPRTFRCPGCSVSQSVHTGITRIEVRPCICSTNWNLLNTILSVNLCIGTNQKNHTYCATQNKENQGKDGIPNFCYACCKIPQ